MVVGSGMTDPRVPSETLARQFHEIYERLAPQFGYETRKETRAFDPNTPNGKLMIAVCEELREREAKPVKFVSGSCGGQFGVWLDDGKPRSFICLYERRIQAEGLAEELTKLRLYARPPLPDAQAGKFVHVPTSENEAKLMVLLGMQYLGLDKVDSLPVAAAPESEGRKP